MKKVFLLLAVFASALSASAQEVRGETLYYYPGDAEDDVTASIVMEDSSDPASVPVTFYINNPTKQLQAYTAYFYAPSGAVFVKDGTACKRVLPDEYTDTNLWTVTTNLKSSNRKATIGMSNNTVDVDNFIQPSTEPIKLMTIYLDASGLADGDYEITSLTNRPNSDWGKAIIPFDGANSGNTAWASVKQKIYVFSNATTTLTATFRKEGNNITGVSRVIADEEVADKSIYTVDGIKVKTMQPNHLYIVNGKKVVVGK